MEVAKAPYASVGVFTKVLKKIRDLSFSTIGARDLSKQGFSQYDASSAASTLKFLGITDIDSKVTDLYRAIKPDSTYQKSMERIVREAYKGLFNTLGENLESKGRPVIQDAILIAYPDMAKKTTPKAALLFIWLCSQGGIALSKEDKIGDLKSSKITKSSRSEPKERTENQLEKRSSTTNDFAVSVNFNISITMETSEEEIFRSLKRVQDSLSKFNKMGSQ